MFRTEDDSERKNAYSSAADSLNRRDYGAAESILGSLLRESEVNGRLDKQAVTMLETVAALYCIERNYEPAEAIYRQILETKERLLGSDNESLIDSLESLAVVMRETGRNSEAGELCYRALCLNGSGFRRRQA